MNTQTQTILITGGAGFIGSHLSERLLREGNRVICVDNLLTGSEENIAALQENPQFLFINHDIVEPLFIDEPVDQVYNLACPASPIQYQKNAIRTIKANTIGLINMLGLARAKDAVFLQASTSEVYGDPDVHPQPEEYRGNVNPIGPRACYDEGKRCAETLCFDYKREHDMRIKVARIFNTYGPRMAKDDGRVISNFIVQALAGSDITVYGKGEQTRSFCYVDDLVDGLIRLMNSADDVTGPINLGNTEEYTIAAVADKVISYTNSTSTITHMPLPEDDPVRRKPVITAAKEVLDWEPTVPFDTGLQQTIDYFSRAL